MLSAHSIELATKAILARFHGDAGWAEVYCALIAHDYPRLEAEYTVYFNAIHESAGVRHA